MNYSDNILVSVIMPVFNCEKYVVKSIESALNQTYKNIELIIIDDCSLDNKYMMVDNYRLKDSRIKVYKNEMNLGVASTRNRAIDLSSGEYIAFLDGDDLWREDKIEKQLAYMIKEKAKLSFTSYHMIDKDNLKCCPDYIVPKIISYNKLLINNVIGCYTVLLKNELLEKHRFLTDFYHEDYVLWLMILKEGHKAVGLKEPLVKYRVMNSSKAGNKKKSAKYRYQIYRNFLKLPHIKCMTLFVGYAISGAMKYRRYKGESE